MNRRKLQTAVDEAERFLCKALECLRLDAVERRDKGDLCPQFDLASSQKATAAVKRASLDLSRVLTELRKVGRRGG
jgi:hypothetical protein